MKILKKRQILLLHSALIAESGGSDGIRDEFLNLNSITLSYEDDELISTILSVASGEMDADGLLKWIQQHID